MEKLQASIQYIKGVGPKRAELLARLGIETPLDLLRHYPRTWENRKDQPTPAPPLVGPFVFRGRIIKVFSIPTRARLGIFKASVRVPAWGEDPAECVWFKRLSHRYDALAGLKEDLKPGNDIWIVGKADPELLKPKDIHVEEHYLVDDPKAALHVGRITPLYPLTEGLTQKMMREFVAEALQLANEAVDIVPRKLIEKRKLLATLQALQGIHFPRSSAELEASRRRLAYEELLELQLAWAIKQRQTIAINKAYGYRIDRKLLTPFKANLGFELTRAQKHAINEIFNDLQSSHPMTRLLQGDVGSGKTVVAIAALLLAVENGYQGAFMAPTEILAEQHFWTLSKFLRGLPVKVELLTASVKAKKKDELYQRVKNHEIDILVGTHAILEENVAFSKLRLAIVDEQHRFGVRQRATLRRKGPPMDLLIMTATPIPRTLSLALFGDLSVSSIDELPPGRLPVKTLLAQEHEALAAIRSEAALGRQSFVVYPIISESSRVELKAAQAEYERLKNDGLKGLRVALIHGRLPGRDKGRIMEEFAAGQYDVLVATPVIEVGMDVANATTMVIQNADRFGLASLHQLRGRIGRGSEAGTCWLLADPKTPEARRRLQTLCDTTDGFKVGEEDLRLRGPGEILGTDQHGALSLKVADLFKDADIQAEAREDALELLEADPALTQPANRALRGRLIHVYQKRWETVDLA